MMKANWSDSDEDNSWETVSNSPTEICEISPSLIIYLLTVYNFLELNVNLLKFYRKLMLIQYFVPKIFATFNKGNSTNF